MSNNARAKWAYIAYNDIQAKIDDGTLDSYDIIYTKDSHENLIISPDLKPIPIHSKIYIFNSIEDAEKSLNESTDTYEGQIVSVLIDDVYKGYIVNKDSNGIYSISSLADLPNGEINYDTLGNRPIINLVGTLEHPIMVSELDVGIYNVKGQYRISTFEETVYLCASDVLMIVSKTDNDIIIKKITSDSIIDYVITDTKMKSDSYATDSKIEALYSSIEGDIKKYVEEAVQKFIEDSLNDAIDARFEELIEEIGNNEVSNLFN